MTDAKRTRIEKSGGSCHTVSYSTCMIHLFIYKYINTFISQHPGWLVWNNDEGLVRHTISQGQVSPNQSQVSSAQWRHFNTTVTGLVKQRNCRKPFFTESEPFLQFYTFYLDINSDAPAHDQQISPSWFTLHSYSYILYLILNLFL